MTGIKPMMVNYAADQPKTLPKSRFYQITDGYYVNPKQVGIIMHGKKPNSTVLLAPDTSKMITLTNALPEQIVKAFDRMA